jgi:magnesium chelatase family protein
LDKYRGRAILFRVHSAAVAGIHAYPITVEVDLSSGEKLNLTTVGLPDTAVRESSERVKAALRNCGFVLPKHKITINLAPASLRKVGSGFDLPMAVGILGVSGKVPQQDLDRFLFLGELSLDGSLRPIKGILPMALMAREQGMEHLVVPEANAREGAVVPGIRTHAIRSLLEVVSRLKGHQAWMPLILDHEQLLRNQQGHEVDFKDVRGQFQAKRALEVAVAGGHNVALVGPPGSGKTMLARRLPTILPPMSFEEAIETTKIHSVAGLVPESDGLIATRPFRAPHHTTSYAGLVGGGSIPRPGEVSLAHNGVLFLDELAEFQRHVLDSLRQPLEDGKVTIGRATMTLRFPARFVLAAAMNPCPCGHLGDDRKECTCNPGMIQRYLARISGPLLDRIDMHIPVPAVHYQELASDEPQETSAQIRKRILAARRIQSRRLARFRISCNARMTSRAIRRFCRLDSESSKLLEHALTRIGLSARAYDRILKVARTLADLEGVEHIQSHHVSEAIQYRSLDRTHW